MSSSCAGIPSEYTKKETSKIVLIPVTFNSNKNNTHLAPEAIINAFNNNISLYDIETDSEVYKQGIYTAENISDNDVNSMTEAVHSNIKKNLKLNKFTAVIGGDSTVNIGTVRAFNEHYENLSVLHIGANANLKKPTSENDLSFESAMYEAQQNTNLVQVGIRKLSALEKSIVDFDKTFFAYEMVNDDYWMENAIEQLSDDVLICFDADGLDVSILPNSVSALPGGLFWYETLDFLKKIYQDKNVVGFSFTNLNTHSENIADNNVAATLIYNLFINKFETVADDNEVENDTYFEDKKNKIGKFNDSIE